MEVDGGAVVGLCTGDGHLAAQLHPGHGEDGAAVAVREGNHVLLIVVRHRDHGLPDHVYTDGQPQELRLGPDVAVQADAFVVVLCVEG